MNLHRDLQIQTALNLCKQFASMVQYYINDDCWTGPGARDALNAAKELLPQIDRALEAVQSEGDHQTNFTAMGMLNTLADNPFNSGWSAIDHQIKLIESEFNELKDGIVARDIHEVRDGIQDMLVTVYGLAWRGGFPADVDAAEVVRSNLSKFDPSKEDAILTKNKYLAIGVETFTKTRTLEDGEICVVTFSAVDQVGTDGKKYPKNKWLKSHRFQEPVYTPLHPLVAKTLEVK